MAVWGDTDASHRLQLNPVHHISLDPLLKNGTLLSSDVVIDRKQLDFNPREPGLVK